MVVSKIQSHAMLEYADEYKYLLVINSSYLYLTYSFTQQDTYLRQSSTVQ